MIRIEISSETIDGLHQQMRDYVAGLESLAVSVVSGLTTIVNDQTDDQATTCVGGSSTGKTPSIPWDARIHSSGRTVTAKGEWTRKKNVDEATYNAVMVELQAIAAAGSPAPIASTPAAPAVPPPPAAIPAAPAVPPPPAAIPAAPAVPPPPAAIPAAPAVPPPPAAIPAAPLFPELCMRVLNAVQASKCTQEQINEVTASIHQMPHYGGYASREDLIPSLLAVLAAKYGV